MTLRLTLLFYCFFGAVYAFSIAVENYEDTSLHVRNCVANIVRKYVERRTLLFLKEELDQFDEADAFLRDVNKPKMLLGNGKLPDMSGFFILFPNESTSYASLLNRSNYEDGKFLLIWHREGNITVNKLAYLFEEFWKYSYVNVVGLVSRNGGDSIEMFTFKPYSENNCNSVGIPTLANEWNAQKNRFTRKNDFFSFQQKLRNMHKCSLKCIGNNMPPDNVMILNRNGWTSSGVGSKVLQIAQEYLNFTPVLVPPRMNISEKYSWYYFHDEFKNITESLRRVEVDLAFGWYSYANFERDYDTELTRVTSIDCFGWAVPYRAGPKPSNWTYYIYEFSYLTWFLIVVVIFITSFVFHTVSYYTEEKVRRQNLFSSLLLSYRTHLEQPSNLHQRSLTFSMFFINFCWYCLVITTAYKTSFGSFMTVPSHGKEFICTKDIIDSPLRIVGSAEMQKVLNITNVRGKSNEVIRRLKVLPLCDFEEVMSRLIRHRDTAVLGVKRFLYYNSLKEAKRLRVKIPFRFIPGCHLRAYTTQFMFKKGSHLIKPFNALLNKLFESGIISFSILHLGSNKVLPLERIRGRHLTLKFLKNPFLVLIAGYIIAIFVFFLEILIYRYNSKRNDNS